MSGTKSEPLALLLAVKGMNYKKLTEILKTQGIRKDDTWMDYMCLIYAVLPKNVKPFDWESNTINIIKLLLKSGCRAKGPKTKNLCTPLYYAVQSMEKDKKQALQIIEILLEAGASITDKDKNEDTPLQLAMKNKKSKAVELMLSKYDVKNINIRNRDEAIHFIIACIKNNWPLVEEFMKKGMKISGSIDSSIFSNLDWPKNSSILHIAVRNEAACVVRILLKYGVNFTSQDENQQSPLHIAYYSNEEEIKKTYGMCKGRFGEMIDSILSAHIKNSTNPIDKEGLSHFHIACIKNNITAVKNFLKNGVDMKKLCSTNANSDIFLNYAVRNKNEEMIKILIQYGADVNGKGSNGQTPLNLAMKLKYHEIANKLLSLGANFCIQDDKGNSPIHNAFFSLPDTKMLLDQMLLIHQGKMSNISNVDGLTVFHIACATDNIDIVKNLIKNEVDVNASVSRKSSKSPGFTALHFAAQICNKAVIKLLLKHDANVDAVNKEGSTPVILAIESPPKYKHVYAFVKSKLEGEMKSCEDEAEDEDDVLIKLIYKEFKHMEIVQLFIQKNCNLNHIDKKGKPLLFRAFFKLLDEFSSSFTSYGSFMINDDNNNRIKNICSTFFINNFQETMNLLIENGVNVNVCDKEGNCILHHIIHRMKYTMDFLQIETAEMFLKKGANADIQNKEGELPINQAIKNRDDKLLKLFLKYNVSLNSVEEKYDTPLHIAACLSCNDRGEDTNYYDMIKLLLANGANINVRNSTGRTPIFEACKGENRGKAMELLLQNGADVNAKDKDGRTALFPTVIHNNDKCLKILLEYGADITVKDKYDMSIFKKLFTYHTPANVRGNKFIHVVTTLATHMRKLQLLGHTFSRSDLLYCKRLKYAYGNGNYPQDLKDLFKKEKQVDLDIFDEDDKLTAELKEELKKMKVTPIDKFTQVYDILFKDLHQMKNYIKNENFKKCLKDNTFPHFGFMLRLKFNKGSTRCVLLKSAKMTSKLLTKKKLPDSCLYSIFAHLTNDDLRNLIDV